MNVLASAFRALIVVIGITLIPFSFGQGNSDSYHYIYHKQVKPLPLNPDHIMVQLRDEAQSPRVPAVSTAHGFAAAIAGLGFSPDDVEPELANGWLRLRCAAAAEKLLLLTNATDRIRYLVDALAARYDVAFATPVFFAEAGRRVFPTSQLLVGFESSVTPDAQRQFVAQLGAKTSRQLGDWSHWVVATNHKNGLAVLTMANELSAQSAVRYAEPDMVMECTTGSTPHASSWPLNNTGQVSPYVSGFDLNAASSFPYGEGSGIRALILDSGVEMSHPALGQINGGIDFTATSSTPKAYPQETYENHGTAVAGCFAGVVGGNAIGSAPGATATAARIGNNYQSNDEFSMQTSWFTDALYWGITYHFCRITNNSNRFFFTSSAIDSLYQDTSSTVIHFACAGNTYPNAIWYPASLSSVQAVGAVMPDGARASFSNTGSEVDFVAPGYSCYTTDRTGSSGYFSGDYGNKSGTSFASPYCAGVAAVVWTRNPSYTPSQVISNMQSNAIDLGSTGRDDSFGWGMVQLP
jgi:subtilisin family serine protease